MSAPWIESVARRVAIGSAAALILVVTVSSLLQFARFVDVPGRILRRVDRFTQPADAVVLAATVAFLASVLVAQQIQSRTWRSRRGFAVFVTGGALIAGGLANIVMPGYVYPAGQLCTYDWDVVICELRPWLGAPVAALVGAAAMQLGANLNRAAKQIP